MLEVVIVDYGVGNLRSVARAVAHCGARPILARTPAEVRDARLMIVPGVGAFASCIAALKQHNLEEPVLEVVASGRPVLGICVGMQMLLDEGEEFGRHVGLGLIPGTVCAIPQTNPAGVPHKIPHIGWSALSPAGDGWANSIFEAVEPGDACYFVHSFAAVPVHDQHRLASCSYNGQQICAAVRKDNLFGVQFHPEKSGPVGMKILSSFLSRA